jgi:hypothetical protein
MTLGSSVKKSGCRSARRLADPPVPVGGTGANRATPAAWPRQVALDHQRAHGVPDEHRFGRQLGDRTGQSSA